MARPKKQNSSNPNNFLINQSSILGSAVLALIIIVLGFFALNGLSQTSTKNTTNKSNTTQQTQKTNSQKTSNDSINKATKPATTPTSHTVVSGESLWKIAVSVYNDGYKWTQIADANKLADPNHITVGMVLTLPQLATQPTSVSTDNQSTGSTPNNNQKITYTVTKGDCLWTIAEHFYGTGYKWVALRDANSSKVGLLPNGRPLITPGTVLTIPLS